MKQYIILLLFLLLFVACEDIFVKDISDQTVDIVAPKKNVILDKNEVTLVWEELKGVKEYHIIIVSPSYDKVLYYACDSVTEDYKLKISLPNGSYEWSVQALNSAHSSLKSNETFQVAAQ